MNIEELKIKYTEIFNNNFWNMIINNLDKPLNWFALSSNPNITDIIKNNR